MLISLSTGSIYKWSNNINELIKVCKNSIKLGGLELMLADKESLDNLILSGDNIKWLKNLQHLTLHAPTKIVSDSKSNLEVENQLDAIQSIYDRINARALIFHVTNLPKMDLLNKFNFKFIIENTTRSGNVNLDEFVSKAEEYRCGVCLDVSHAYTWSIKESERYFSRLRNRIFQIHCSVSSGAHDHLPFSMSSNDFKSSIEFMKKTRLPVIVESDYNEKGLEFLVKDIKALTDYLNNNSK